jgi:DNA-binding response OmpR family regulator
MPKVLIIDDRRENIVFIANNILKPMGYEVITARDGQTGLQKAEEEGPDLIITDLRLPKMGGLEILERLTEKEIYTPTIVMTFHGSEETAMKALRLGARDYLIKPFSIEEMEEALERAFKPPPRANDTSRQEAEAAAAEIKQLEEEMEQLRVRLAEREEQFKQLQPQSAEYVNKEEMDEMAQRALAWEEDNARLNQVLAQTKDALYEAESRAKVLEQAAVAQKVQLGKYRQEIERLAEKLHNLSEAMRLMSQDMEQQASWLGILTPREED